MFAHLSPLLLGTEVWEVRNQRGSFTYEQAETGCGRKSSAVNAVTYEEVCSEKKTELTLGLLSHCGAVTRGLTNWAPQLKEPATDCSLVLLVLIAVALDAICFVFHLFFCWDWILYSLRLCFAPYLLGDEIPLSCDSKPYVMDYKSGKRQSPHTALVWNRQWRVSCSSLLPFA